MTMTIPVTQAPSSRAQLRILIVEDHMLFAESLELVLSVEGYDVRRIAVPDNSGSPGTLLSSLVRLRPRIVLLDLDLGRFGDGTRLIAPLAKAGINVVVVTASSDRGRWGEAIRYGARTVLSKAQPLSNILATVRRINEGLPVMTHEEREDLLRTWHQQRSEIQELLTRLSLLTARESQVLGRLMQGRTVHDIATLSVVSEATVRTQVKSILAKLEVSSQLAAVGLAHQVGWRPPALT
jgi:two-component system, NarL family, nitrate/nitrite response regulator NarL